MMDATTKVEAVRVRRNRLNLILSFGFELGLVS